MANEQPRGYRPLDAIAPIVIAVIVLIVGFIQKRVSLTWPVVAAGIGLAVLSVTLGYVGARFYLRDLLRDLTTSVLMSISPTQKLWPSWRKGVASANDRR
jgi:threonine/homoserine efflux transporter RhtA